ncbi:MAG: glutamate synthase [Verrucomicrobia bacterium]|jgi:methylamine---glutamate N-methyltransferase subunit C|nr:glutamate synthase [Verrucomicrobiota bacterium]
MAAWECSLCSYVYDEEKESVRWDDLPADWVCPICGSPKSAFTPVESTVTPSTPVTEARPSSQRNRYQCGLCAHIYDENQEDIPWEELPDDWMCPVCGSGKESFAVITTASVPATPETASSVDVDSDYLAEWRRPADEFEGHMADIHRIAESGHSVIEPMRTRLPSFSWDEILVRGAQLSKLPLNKSQPVSTRTTIGPGAAVPMVIESPLFVSHMSYGALSREAKLALAKGSAHAATAMCSGEGGVLPECLEAAHKYIFEYVPNKYSVTDETLKGAAAVEIKIGQSAKPGMGGLLPGHKVTREIAQIRGFREGTDIVSPSHFPDILTRDDLKETIEALRARSGGKPIGVKLAAGHLEADIDIALYAGTDFITIDGRAGGTAAAPKVVKDAASVPTLFALARARAILDARGANGVSLIITGGMRVSSDFAKALAMGADAIAVATAAMMAVGCQQYRICDTGKCPLGIATQDPALRARLNVNKSATRVGNFFRVSTEELKEFARLTGNDDVHGLSMTDLCTTNSEISNHVGIEHV